MRELNVMFSSLIGSVEHDRLNNIEITSASSAKPLFTVYRGNKHEFRNPSKSNFSQLKLATNIEVDNEDIENDNIFVPKIQMRKQTEYSRI